MSGHRAETITEQWTRGSGQVGASRCWLCVLSSGVICNCISIVRAIGKPDNRAKNQGRGFHLNHIHIFSRRKRVSQWIKRFKRRLRSLIRRLKTIIYVIFKMNEEKNWCIHIFLSHKGFNGNQRTLMKRANLTVKNFNSMILDEWRQYIIDVNFDLSRASWDLVSVSKKYSLDWHSSIECLCKIYWHHKPPEYCGVCSLMQFMGA